MSGDCSLKEMLHKADLFRLLETEFREKSEKVPEGEEEQLRPRIKVYFTLSSLEDPLQLLNDPYLPEKLRRRLSMTKTDESDFFVLGYRHGQTRTVNFYLVTRGSIWAFYTLASSWVVQRSLRRILFHSPMLSPVWLPAEYLERLAESFAGWKNIYSFTSRFSPFREDVEKGIERLTVRLWGRKAYSHMTSFEEQYSAKPTRIGFDIVSSNPGLARIAVSSDGCVLLDSGELSAFAAVASSYDGIVRDMNKYLIHRGARTEEVKTGDLTNVSFHLGRPLIINLSRPLTAERFSTLREMFTSADPRTRFAGYIDQCEDDFLSLNVVDLANQDGFANLRNSDENTLIVSLLRGDNPRTLQRIFQLIVNLFDTGATSEISKVPA
jgi:hypothetical protein